MTGRELIVYILENKLEDEDIFKDGTFVGLMTEEEAAAKFQVGVPSIRLWHRLGLLRSISIGPSVFVFRYSVDPRINLCNNKGEIK